MKRTLAMLLASLFVLQMIPSAVFADTAAQVPEVRNVVTVSFGGDEYIFADGYTMEILPEAEECERYIFDGWYDGDAKIEAPFTPKGDMVLEARYVHRGTLIAESPARLEPNREYAFTYIQEGSVGFFYLDGEAALTIRLYGVSGKSIRLFAENNAVSFSELREYTR